MTTLTSLSTSTSIKSTGESNQRKTDRCQNGVLWATYIQNPGASNPFAFRYSLDNGITWSAESLVSNATAVAATTYVPNHSFFIDLDDYAHLVFKDNKDGKAYYQRGTPNAGRTAWTWSATVQLGQFIAYNYLDVVAFRTPGSSPTTWSVAIVLSYFTVGGTTNALFSLLNVSNAGVVTAAASTGLGVHDNVNIPVYNIMSYAPTVQTYPSIDFNHTGDGKTVAGGMPHLYVAWSSGGAGAGLGIAFKKAVFAAGTWTWNATRSIDTTGYVTSDQQWLVCFFDGTRVCIAGQLTGAGHDLILHERDAADTTTVFRVLVDNATAGTNGTFYGGVAFDTSGDVYIFGRYSSGSSASHYRKWTRSTASLGAFQIVSNGFGNGTFSVRRGFVNGRIEWINTEGTATPYSIAYSSVIMNIAPNIPTLVQKTGLGTDTTPTFSASITDPDSTDQIKAQFRIKQGATVIGTVDSVLTTGAHTAVAEYASALAVGSYTVAAKTIDSAGLESVFSDEVAFNITQQVSISDVYLWDLKQGIKKELAVLWDTQQTNNRSMTFKWDIKQAVIKSVTFKWESKTPWEFVELDTPLTLWEEVGI